MEERPQGECSPQRAPAALHTAAGAPSNTVTEAVIDAEGGIPKCGAPRAGSFIWLRSACLPTTTSLPPPSRPVTYDTRLSWLVSLYLLYLHLFPQDLLQQVLLRSPSRVL